MKTTTLALILKQEEKVFNKNTLFETKYNELIRLMEENQYFLNTDLNLTFLANKLDLNSHDLSEIINSFANKNFNEFINFYRIEYVKNRILKKNEWQHLKLEALGMEAGFKSRSSFFSVFKKYVGMSPLAYIEYVSS